MADFLNNQFSPIQIVVLAGGDSAEREISLQSGAAVSNALRDRGHRVTQVDPATENLLTRDWSDCDCVFIACMAPGVKMVKCRQSSNRWEFLIQAPLLRCLNSLSKNQRPRNGSF